MSLAARLIRCCTQPRVFDTEELDLSHSNLLEVPAEVASRSRHLVALSLNANAIRNLPFEFYTLNKLTHLDLSDNDIEKLSDLIKNLSLLKAMDLSKNALSSLPNTIQHCIRLEALELSVNPLGSLPEHLTLLQYLQELFINDIYLDSLPTSLGRLANLTILEARDNHLNDLPRSIINLTLLKRLDLGNNQLTFLSPVIGHLSSLEELWVDSNHLKTLPRDLCYLSNLQFLEVSKNRLEYLPEEMDCLTSLTDLHLSDNYLQTLPESISSLKNLNILYTNNNHLQSLPNGIGRLCYLEELSVSDNRIKDIPPSIGSLKHLNHFNADNNELTSLRSEISGCLSLSILSVRNNYLQTLPREISFLSNLVVINISGNRLQYMPFTLTRLKKLLALWIIENQTRPLIEMEPKELECGEKVLVCFLFPQMPPNEIDDVYSRKFNSDNESLGTDVFSEMPHNSSIMFDVVESTSRTENYPKDIYSRQQPKRFSRNSESPYATLSAINADCENYIPSRAHYYAGRYAKTQPSVAKVDNSHKEHIYSHISEDSHSGSNQPLLRNTQLKQQLSNAPSKAHSLCSDPTHTPGYVSSNASGTSNLGGVNTVSTELHTTATHSLGTSPDVSLLQTNNNNKECKCQSGDVSHKLSLPRLQQGCLFSKQFMHNVPRPSMSEIGFPSHTLPHRTQYSPLNTYQDCHPDLTSPPLSCPDTSRYVSQQHFRMAPENVRQQKFPPRGQIYEATVEMDPDYLNVSCQSDMFSPTKPLPVPQSTDVYYSDVGMNVHGGYQKLLKEMNIPNDPSSIQALLQLSAHLANQNGAAPHNQNRYLGEQQSVHIGTGTNRSHSGTNLLHSSSNSPNARNPRSQSNHMMDHCCHRVQSPFYNIPPSHSRHQPSNSFTPPCDCCADTSGHMCANSHLEKTVSHSCTPNTDTSSMAEAATADSGISSVKADTPAPPMCHSGTETNHNGMHKHLSIQSIDSNESEVYHVTLCKDPNVGLSVIGRKSVGTGTEGIFVSQVQSDGPAGISGKIRPGDRILEINGFSLNNATQQEAVELLKIAVGNVELKLRKEKLSTLL